jgi:hypothetical protein
MMGRMLHRPPLFGERGGSLGDRKSPVAAPAHTASAWVFSAVSALLRSLSTNPRISNASAPRFVI